MGAEKDIIVAVELGSQAIRAVAGRREPDGTMQVLAIAREDASNAIRKGLVDNIDKTTQAISHVVRTLNEKLGIYTTRIYVGLAGQSLHTKLNVVPYQLIEKSQITAGMVDQMMEINSGVVYPDSKILDVVPQEYKVGNRRIADPVGMMSESLEAHFMNVVARNSLSENIERCVRNSGLELAELLISPICLADSLLSSNEKRSGCALVDFGADTTTILVYTNNILRHLAVIPLGGSNVTSDIASKGLEMEEAEEIKLKYGTAFLSPSTEEAKSHDIKLSFGRSISEEELQEIIEARYEEIIFNAKNQIKDYNDKLLSGIMLTGGASRISGLVEAFTGTLHFDKQVRVSKALPNNIVLAPGVTIPESENLNTLFALLLKGDQNCIGEPPVSKEPEPVQATLDFEQDKPSEESSEAEAEAVNPANAKEAEAEDAAEEKKPKPGIKKKVRSLWNVLNQMLTDPEDE